MVLSLNRFRAVKWSKRNWLIGLGMWVLALLIGEGALRYLDVLDPPAFEDSPDHGYLMRPDQSVSTRGIRFQINPQGFRGADFSASKPDGVVRIAFVGDSITYGGGSIPDDDLFVNEVAVLLSAGQPVQYRGLNLSAPGWGIQNMASYISAKGVHGADWIVWVISSVDFRRPKTTRADNGFWRSKPWSRFVYGIAAMLHKTNLLSFGRNGASDPDVGPAIVEQNLGALSASLQGTRSQGLRGTIVIVPVASETEEHARDARRFEALAHQLSVPFLHLGPVFQQAGAADLFSDGVHLTERGHQVAAKAMATHLQGFVKAGPASPATNLPGNPPKAAGLLVLRGGVAEHFRFHE